MSHCLQLYGLSPVWILLCLFNWLESENFASHLGQSKGFSPVCTLLWVFKCCFVIKVMSHLEQLEFVTSRVCHHSEFFHASLWYLIVYIDNHTANKRMAYPQCAFFHASLIHLKTEIACYNVSNWRVWLLCGFLFHAFSNYRTW